MNIPTKVFLETPTIDFSPGSNIAMASEPMFKYMANILLDTLEHGGMGEKFSLEDIANNNVRFNSPQEVARAMNPIFEWEVAVYFHEYCENLGYQFGEHEPEDVIDWGVVHVLLNEFMAELPNRIIDSAKRELEYIEKKNQEYRSYYLNMPIEARKLAVNEKLKELRKQVEELKSFIQ